MFGSLFGSRNKVGRIVTDGDICGGTYRSSSSMASITINGMTVTGSNISVNGKTVMVDGKVVDGVELSSAVDVIRIEGGVASVTSDRPVSCGDVAGNVSAKGPVNCGDVKGSVDAMGPVNAGDVGGDLRASGPVVCGDIKGCKL